MTLPYLNDPMPDMRELNILLERTKGSLLFRDASAFYGSLCCSHNYIWDDNKPTAWCNGITIGINPRFFAWLEPEERLTLLVHELQHTGFDHIARFAELGPNEDHNLFNQAADHVINLSLLADGFVFGPKLRSLNPCMDPQYEGMLTEQVYELLKKQAQQQPPQPQSGGSGLTGSSGSGGMSQPLNGDIQSIPEDASIQEVREKTVMARNAALRCNEAGNLPGEIEIQLDKILNPKLPWEALLFNWFTEISQDDFSWSRPNRRYDDEYLPSLSGENGLAHIVHFIDVSGSITDEVIRQFNSEVKYIHSVFKPKRMTIITFDTKLHDFFEFDEYSSYDDLHFHGRGGTDLQEVHDYLVKERPSGAVIFTDLYVRPMAADPGVPIIWVCNDNPKAKVPFGRLIHITTEP